MKKVKGDLLELARAGEFDAVVHGCNCFNTMGAGLARQIREQYPQAYTADCATPEGDGIAKLGTYTQASAGTFTIINAYTQYDFNRHGSRADVFEYTAFQLILEKLARWSPGLRYGFPMIGQGLACGDADRIMSQLEWFSDRIADRGGTVTVVEYTSGSDTDK